jgi:hypothetical protein
MERVALAEMEMVGIENAIASPVSILYSPVNAKITASIHPQEAI